MREIRGQTKRKKTFLRISIRRNELYCHLGGIYSYSVKLYYLLTIVSISHLPDVLSIDNVASLTSFGIGLITEFKFFIKCTVVFQL
jgi:hypothetical protein